jgi:hypothetical protein
VEASKCGLGNGEKATGEPIKLGAINTKQPGTDFTEIARAAEAYFNCVNDNGGIDGRPIHSEPELYDRRVVDLFDGALGGDEIGRAGGISASSAG